MFDWLVKLFSREEKVRPVITPLVNSKELDKPKKAGRRPGIRTTKKKTSKK